MITIIIKLLNERYEIAIDNLFNKYNNVKGVNIFMKKFASLTCLICVMALASGCMVTNNQNGRYQIHQSTLNARDQFLLDTATGKVYQLVDNNGTNVWSEMDVYSFTAEHYNKNTPATDTTN